MSFFQSMLSIIGMPMFDVKHFGELLECRLVVAVAGDDKIARLGRQRRINDQQGARGKRWLHAVADHAQRERIGAGRAGEVDPLFRVSGRQVVNRFREGSGLDEADKRHLAGWRYRILDVLLLFRLCSRAGAVKQPARALAIE